MATNKDVSRYLLNCYEIEYAMMPQPGKSFLKKAMTLLSNTVVAIKFFRRNKIDLAVTRVSPYIALAAFFLRKPHIALSDTETSGIYDTIFTKFVSAFITAKSFRRTLRKDQIRLNGNIELFYLHPKRFRPDDSIFDLLGINKNEPYVVMRFVSWDAYHDKGLSGFTNINKFKAVKAFSNYARVFVSAEKELSPELEPFRIKIPPEKMHDALAYACMFFGESATMASESAVLGTPAIYLNESWLGYTDEEADSGLLFKFKSHLEDQEKAISKGVELLASPDTKNVLRNNRNTFLKDKIDLTAFMVWFIVEFPESLRIMKKKPDYQKRFG